MSISDAQWTAVSDPFRVVDVSIASITSAATFAGTIIGAISGIQDDEDVQEVFVHNADGATTTIGNESAFGLFRLQASPFNANDLEIKRTSVIASKSGLHRALAAYESLGNSSVVAFATAHPNWAAGSDNAYFGIRTAYHWAYNDPAQLIMAWAHHYCRTNLSAYMDKASFQQASADTQRMSLSCWREVDKTIASQIDDVMRHTLDWLAIKPSASGALSMFYVRRRYAVDRPTVIDFDDGADGVSEYKAEAHEDLTISEMHVRFAGTMTKQIADASVQGSYNDQEAERGFPLDMPSTEDVVTITRRTDRDSLDIDAPYAIRRQDIVQEFDIGMFAYAQLDLSFTQGPLQLNYEIGDLIHISCASLGLDGTEAFVVYEKRVDMETMHARVRALRVYGATGTDPLHAGSSPTTDLLGLFRIESLPNHVPDYAPDILYPNNGMQPRHQWEESWIDLSTRTDKISRSAGLRTLIMLPSHVSGAWRKWRTGQAQGPLSWSISGISARALGFVFVIKNQVPFPLFDELLLEADNAGTPFRIYAYRFADATMRIQVGAAYYCTTDLAAQAGTSDYYVLTLIVSGSGKVRINGTQVETFSAALPALSSGVRMFDNASNTAPFRGNILEFSAYDDLAGQDFEGIETRLMERYNIGG